MRTRRAKLEGLRNIHRRPDSFICKSDILKTCICLKRLLELLARRGPAPGSVLSIRNHALIFWSRTILEVTGKNIDRAKTVGAESRT